jgi:hypothetical protein
LLAAFQLICNLLLLYSNQGVIKDSGPVKGIPSTSKALSLAIDNFINLAMPGIISVIEDCGA